MNHAPRIRIKIDKLHPQRIKVNCAEKEVLAMLNQEFYVHSVFEQVINLQSCDSKQLLCLSCKYLARYTLQVSHTTISELQDYFPSTLYLDISTIASCSLDLQKSNFLKLCSLHSKEVLATSLKNIIPSNSELNSSLIELNFQKNIQKQGILLINLIGLGHGLTPSGDDFIVGYLCAALALNINMDQAIECIKTNCRNLTNSISAGYLENATNRLFPSPLLKLLQAYGIEDLITQATFILENIGSTSGRDLILGIIACLEQRQLIVESNAS